MTQQKPSNLSQQVLLNEKIKYKTLFLIDDEGNNIGEIATSEALKMAEAKGLDLLVIAIQGPKVIAKIIDYGKYKFSQQRKQKQNKKNQVVSKVKEVKVKPLIGDHDLKVKIDAIKKWLKQGNKVRFSIEARGRLGTKTDLIQGLYSRFIEFLENEGNLTQENKQVNAFRYETIIEPK